LLPVFTLYSEVAEMEYFILPVLVACAVYLMIAVVSPEKF
jgi:hypothetical protein